MVIYYEYNGSLSDTGKTKPIFDDIPNDDETGQNARTKKDDFPRTFVATGGGQRLADGTPINRLWTKTGWSDMAISQDFAYGIVRTSTTGENGDDRAIRIAGRRKA